MPLLGFGSVAPLALLGALVAFRTRRAVRLLCGFVAVYWASMVAFHVFSRGRIHAVPALLPLVARPSIFVEPHSSGELAPARRPR